MAHLDPGNDAPRIGRRHVMIGQTIDLPSIDDAFATMEPRASHRSTERLGRVVDAPCVDRRGRVIGSSTRLDGADDAPRLDRRRATTGSTADVLSMDAPCGPRRWQILRRWTTRPRRVEGAPWRGRRRVIAAEKMALPSVEGAPSPLGRSTRRGSNAGHRRRCVRTWRASRLLFPRSPRWPDSGEPLGFSRLSP